jgi:hypothetical protein
MEDKYLAKHQGHVIKLENFRKKVYAVGVYDPQLLGKKILSPEEQMEIAQNSKLIRELIKDVKPENTA